MKHLKKFNEEIRLVKSEGEEDIRTICINI
jgi:hypothetical protein